MDNMNTVYNNKKDSKEKTYKTQTNKKNISSRPSSSFVRLHYLLMPSRDLGLLRRQALPVSSHDHGQGKKKSEGRDASEQVYRAEQL